MISLQYSLMPEAGRCAQMRGVEKNFTRNFGVEITSTSAFPGAFVSGLVALARLSLEATLRLAIR